MITALVAMPDGSQVVRDSIGGPADDAEQLARTLANKLIAAGARDILAAIDNANGD
jgi:hydroxymethylbilane synthase